MAEGFFQTQNRLAAKRAAATVPRPASDLPDGAGSPAPLSITQLTQKIDRAIKTGVPGAVLVRGEVSNYRPHRGSGHLYFTLKDATACLDCVMWKEAATKLKFTLSDGVELIAGGRVAVYADKGKYQLYVNTLSPLGQGALELAVQQLRAKLQKEGLFAAERKKPLPAYPLRVALVTGSSTAALQDMLKVLRRFPWLRLYLYDVPVQGDGAGERIAAALHHLSARHESVGGIDVILVGRGGGSLEDLWAFNEECVARAVAASAIPVVTGVGHEIDVTIADLVADHHAHTPTEAAQTIVARWRQASDALGTTGTRLRRCVRQVVQDAGLRLASIERHEVFRRPLDRITALRQLLDDRERSLTHAVGTRLRRCGSDLGRLETKLSERHPRHAIALRRTRLDATEKSLDRAVGAYVKRRLARVEALEAHLKAVGPEQVLQRGYTITTRKKDGTLLRSASAVKRGEMLVTRFADGTVESVADDPKQPKLF